MKSLFSLSLACLTFISQPVSANERPEIIMYKQAGCMCCDKHADILREEGFDVLIETRDNVNFLKSELAIPRQFAGCHTMLVDNYIVEGHVPGDIIKRLLKEKPQIRGVALPGMPRGTPGMPGPRDELLDVYVLKDGEKEVYDRF